MSVPTSGNTYNICNTRSDESGRGRSTCQQRHRSVPFEGQISHVVLKETVGEVSIEKKKKNEKIEKKTLKEAVSEVSKPVSNTPIQTRINLALKEAVDEASKKKMKKMKKKNSSRGIKTC